MTGMGNATWFQCRR